ncbi:MAG: redoxin domain-containing protein [Nitrospirota bacterium]
MDNPPISQRESSAEPQPGWWGRQTLLTRLLIISVTLLFLSGYLVVRDLNRAAPDFDGATQWINSKPLRAEDLQGKIILVDFWTLSCINCIRTFPYLKAWDEKYRDQGLVIIGVHTPEFAFEQTAERVEEAVARFGLTYPIAVDNNRAIWDGFANHWWPHKYLLDSQRRIRNEWIGEGAYDDVERAIQRLLAEERGRPITRDYVKVSAEPMDPRLIRTPEIYFGYSFVSDFGTFNLGNQMVGQLREQAIDYTLPDEAQMADNLFYLGGTWKLQDEKTELMESEEAHIVLSYEAKAVNMVADRTGATAIVSVTRNGRPLDPAIAGADVRFDSSGRSYVEVDRGRMYRLIDDPAGYGRHRIRLETRTKGFSIYTITFG